MRKMMYRLTLGVFVLLSALMVLLMCGKNEFAEENVRAFINDLEQRLKPLSIAANQAYFDASISGDEADYKKSETAQIQFEKALANRDDFDKIKKYREKAILTDSVLKRELDVYYLMFLGKQLPEEQLSKLIEKQTAVEAKYNTFRVQYNGESVTDNRVEEILKTETDSRKLQDIWENSKKIGELVAADIIELVRLRNEIATALGYANFHAMELALSEQDPQQIEQLFDELDTLTRDRFAQLKGAIDQTLSQKYGIRPEGMQAWHYQNRFFQEAPAIFPVNLDQYYQDQDIAQLTRDYYQGIGLPIEDILAKSDLYEKPGKFQHAYCTDIDRQGDVRVVCNIKANQSWMGTMLHEMGHAVYSKYYDQRLPWILHDAAHPFTTEAIAMMIERMAVNAQWMKEMVGISEEESEKISEPAFKSLQLEQLVFSRWAQVMYRFEKSMYENPDQDLNALWWQLVEKYQMIKAPEGRNAPDWAAKIHVALFPVYYHNYLMGAILASQLQYYIGHTVLAQSDQPSPALLKDARIGQFLTDKVFHPGALYPWNEMIEKATGEKLTAKYYANQFVGN